MHKLERREFLKTATTVAAGGMALGPAALELGAAEPALAAATPAAPTWIQYPSFTWRPIPKPRPAQNVERMWRTPFRAGNGMQVCEVGIWIVDGQTRMPDGGRASHVYLLDESGRILRAFMTAGETPSGMTWDGQHVWIAATYSREILQCHGETGQLLQRRFTPGAGVIYNTPWDPPGPAYRYLDASGNLTVGESPGGGGGGGGGGQQPAASIPPGTGAHGMEWRDGKLWVAVPPSRMIYRVDPQTWEVEHILPSVHKRPHGIGFDREGYLWEADTTVHTVYKRNPETGEIVDAIYFGADHPQQHGMSIYGDYMWWCDDVDYPNNWVCRMRIT